MNDSHSFMYIKIEGECMRIILVEWRGQDER